MNEHGRRKEFFQGGGKGIFPKVAKTIFPGRRGGGESDEISFFLLEMKKTIFLRWKCNRKMSNFKCQRGKAPPSDVHANYVCAWSQRGNEQ